MFELKIDTSNAVFAGNLDGELARIIGGVFQAIGEGIREGICRDSNNNAVGVWNLTDE